MRLRRALPLVAALVLGGGVFAACSDSTSSNGTVPDLTGTWDLVSLDVAGTNVPGTVGSFTFTATTVDISLTLPQQAPVTGTGTYTLTPTNIDINSTNALIGQASGTYTFIDKPPGTADTLTADLLAQGTPFSVVVARQ